MKVWRKSPGSLESQSCDRTAPTPLDGKKTSSTLAWSSRVFEIVDLQLEREAAGGLYLSTFELEELTEKSGKTQNPVPPIQLSFKIEGREVSLLSGLLGRHCRILELRRHVLRPKEDLLEEVLTLREEKRQLVAEVENLYGALESLQRPTLHT